MTRLHRYLWPTLAALTLLATVLMETLTRTRTVREDAAGVGRPVSPDFPVNAVRKISIVKKGGSVLLTGTDKGWKVDSLYGYPADFKKIADLSRAIRDMKVALRVRSAPEWLDRFAFAPSSEGGARVLTFAADGKAIAAFDFGKARLRRGENGEDVPVGRYVLTSGGAVALIDRPLSELDAPPEEWLERALFSVSSLKSAEVRQGKQRLWSASAASPKSGLRLENVDNAQPDVAKLQDVNRFLRDFACDAVADPKLSAKDMGLDDPLVFIGETFYGLTYRLSVGAAVNGRRYVKIAVEGAPTLPEKVDAIAGKQRLALALELRKIGETARKNRALFLHWTYLVSESRLRPVFYTRETFLNPKRETTVPMRAPAMAPANDAD